MMKICFPFMFICLISISKVNAATRMQIVERVLERTEGEARARAWVFLSYAESEQMVYKTFWKMIAMVADDQDMFDEYLKKEYTSNRDLVNELVWSSSISGTAGHVNLVFDKAHSQVTKHMSGKIMPLLVPPKFSVAALTIMVKNVKTLMANAPLVVIKNELGKRGSDLLDVFDVKQFTADFVKQSAKGLGVIGGTWGAALAGGALCGPACAVGGAITGFVVTEYTFEKFMEWLRTYMMLRPDEALEEAYFYFRLDKDATNAEINRVWRQIARKVHPDHGGNEYAFVEASLKMMLIKRHRLDTKSKVISP